MSDVIFQFALKCVDLGEIYQIYECNISYDVLKEWLANEANILRQLHHPNIVGFEDFFINGRSAYIAMEYVDGPALIDLIPSGGMKEQDAKYYFRQICEAVAYCHSQSVHSSFN